METRAADQKRRMYWKWFFGLSFFTGIILMIFQLNIYRNTIIEPSIPLSIIFFTGLVTYFLIKGKYKESFTVRGFFFSLMQSILSFGFIACYVFMAGNYYWADSNLKQFTFPIRDKSSMPGSPNKSKRNPLVRFDYFGKEKELVFGYSETAKVENSKLVKLTVRKGALGFDVLESYDVE